MSRPIGVTASAIVAILGCIVAVVMSVLALGSLFVQSQPQTVNSGPQVVAGAVMFAVLSGFGVWTAIGVLLLRPWARISILIFAGFLVVGSALALLATMSIPMPPDISADVVQQMRRGIAVVTAV